MAATLLEPGMDGATSTLLNVTGSRTLKLAELNAVAEEVLAAVDPDANIALGMTLDRRLRDEVQVTLIATGLGAARCHGARTSAAAVATPPSAAWRPVWLRDRDAPVPTAAEPDQAPVPQKPRARRAAGQIGVNSATRTVLLHSVLHGPDAARKPGG